MSFSVKMVVCYDEKHSGNSVVRIVIIAVVIVVFAFLIYKAASLSGQVSKLNEQIETYKTMEQEYEQLKLDNLSLTEQVEALGGGQTTNGTDSNGENGDTTNASTTNNSQTNTNQSSQFNICRFNNIYCSERRHILGNRNKGLRKRLILYKDSFCQRSY